MTMRFETYLLTGLITIGGIGCSEDPEPDNTQLFADTPGDVSITTTDIDLFWDVHDAAGGVYVEIDFLNNYFRAGTESLSQFFDLKIRNTSALTQKLSNDDYYAYYSSIRSNTQSIDVGGIRTALNLLETNYPAAVFSDVILVIGALGTGGTVVSNGNMVIGTEFFTRSPNSPVDQLSPWVSAVTREAKYLPSIVLHELIHVQQRNFATKENLTGQGTLLELSLAEGIADFITHLVLGTYFNDHLPEYADPLEESLWNEFQTKMDGTDTSEWLFNAATSLDRPGDLGYYVGFKIAEHYFNQQGDAGEALKDLLEIRNAQNFLTTSNYQSKFN